MEPTRIFLPDTDSDRIAFAMRVLSDSTMNMKASAESESQSNRATIEELRASQATLSRRVQAAERDAYEAKQQLHMMQKNLEEMQGRERNLQAQVNKWKNMSQAFQRMFTETTSEDATAPMETSNNFGSSSNFGDSSFTEPAPRESFAFPQTFSENQSGNTNSFSASKNTSMSQEPDLRSFFAAARAKLSPVELRGLMDHFKQSRNFGRSEFVDKARSILGSNSNVEEMMSQIPALFDRNN